MRMAGVPVRVLIADDRDLMAARTVAALAPIEGFDVVGVAGDAAHAGSLAEMTLPDVALVDVDLPGGGVEAVSAIVNRSPDTRVLAHSEGADHELVIAMLRAGASGYALRGAPPSRLAATLRDAVAGETVFDAVVDRGGIDDLIDQVHAASRAHEERVIKRARIRSVMQRNEMDIAFQPIVALASREIVGYEALARFAA